MTLRELQEKRGELVTAARAALDELTANTDESRATELGQRHDAIMADFDKVEAQIAREERQAAAEARAAATEERARAAQRPGVVAEGRGEDSGREVTYRDAFHALLRQRGDISAIEPEQRAVLTAQMVMADTRAQTAGTTTAGGFLVPTELADMIIKSMKAWGPMYDDGIATVINTSGGNPIKLPTVDDTAVTAVAHTEATALTDTGAKDATIGQKSLDAFAFDTQFVRFSWELTQDSIFNVETLLSDLLAERLGRIANSQLTTGTGSSAPNGVVTASTLGKTAASATAIASDEIIDLLHAVDPAYRTGPKVRFMFNDSVLAAIRKLKDGQGNYLWQMGDVTKGSPGTLLGYRYEINQAMASIATGNKTMLFGDFGKYFVRKVGAPAIGVLRERFWPDLGIAGLIRFDGELGDTAAMKHLIQA